MIGSSSQVRSKGWKARAARIASSAVHFMLASTISGKPSPRCSRMAAHPLDVLGELGPADLHLDGAEALGEIAVGLAQELVERQVEVDAAGVAGHLRVVAAEQAPERQCRRAWP